MQLQMFKNAGWEIIEAPLPSIPNGKKSFFNRLNFR